MKFATFTAIAAALAAPAFAGGLTEAPVEPVIRPAPIVTAAPSGDWTGGYGGVQLGYGELDSDPAGIDGNGGIYGLRGGFDYDFGQFVLGGMADYSGTDINTAGGDSLDSMARLRVRGGYDLGRTLVYASGGAAYAEADIGGVQRDDTGWVLGLGAERMVTDNISIGGEVNYHQFDDFDGTGTDLNATSIEANMNFRF
jgi:opacity protein-like surface antigen